MKGMNHMKKFIEPELTIEQLAVEDVITTSQEDDLLIAVVGENQTTFG